ncbi:MAG: dolichyl-phosphate beta-glucosyltransferase [bacterium]
MIFSIVVPLFNEEKRIDGSLNKIFDFFNSSNQQTELIFVNDGSTDRTLEKLNGYAQKFDFQVISYSQNRGKGYAVRQGAQKASGDWILFFDIDLATPLEEFNNLLATLKDDDEVIIGSRRLPDSMIKKSESFLRTFLGQCFTKISNLLAPGIKDFTCGFKCFSNRAAKDIFFIAKIDRWGFDTEIIFIASLKKKKIRQMPVSWSHDTDSRVKVFGAIFTSANDLFRIIFYYLFGYYK